MQFYPERQRPSPETVDVEPETPAAVGPARQHRAHRHQIRLRPSRAWRRLPRSTSMARRRKRASCRRPAAVGKQITTIEGPVEQQLAIRSQRAWVEIGVPQCGYCQGRPDHGGRRFCSANARNPTEDEIEAAMADNLLPLRNVSTDRPGDPSRLPAGAGIGRLT